MTRSEKAKANTIEQKDSLLKNVRHPLQTNTTLHKQIKAQRPLSLEIIRIEQQPDIVVGQAVAECHEGGRELVEGDGAGVVDVEAVKELAPLVEEAPQPAEFVEGDGAGAVDIEHAMRGKIGVLVSDSWMSEGGSGVDGQRERKGVGYGVGVSGMPVTMVAIIEVVVNGLFSRREARMAIISTHRIIIFTVCGSKDV